MRYSPISERSIPKLVQKTSPVYTLKGKQTAPVLRKSILADINSKHSSNESKILNPHEKNMVSTKVASPRDTTEIRLNGSPISPFMGDSLVSPASPLGEVKHKPLGTNSIKRSPPPPPPNVIHIKKNIQKIPTPPSINYKKKIELAPNAPESPTPSKIEKRYSHIRTIRPSPQVVVESPTSNDMTPINNRRSYNPVTSIDGAPYFDNERSLPMINPVPSHNVSIKQPIVNARPYGWQSNQQYEQQPYQQPQYYQQQPYQQPQYYQQQPYQPVYNQPYPPQPQYQQPQYYQQPYQQQGPVQVYQNGQQEQKPVARQKPNYKAMSEAERQLCHTRLMNKIKTIANWYPNFGFSVPSEDTDVDILDDKYDEYLRTTLVVSSCGDYLTILVIVVFFLEILLRKFFGSTFAGFAKAQIANIIRYQSLMLELGEKQYLGGMSQWPVEARIGATVVISTLSYGAIKYMARQVGLEDIASSIHTFFESILSKPQGNVTINGMDSGLPEQGIPQNTGMLSQIMGAFGGNNGGGNGISDMFGKFMGNGEQKHEIAAKIGSFLTNMLDGGEKKSTDKAFGKERTRKEPRFV